MKDSSARETSHLGRKIQSRSPVTKPPGMGGGTGQEDGRPETQVPRLED